MLPLIGTYRKVAGQDGRRQEATAPSDVTCLAYDCYYIQSVWTPSIQILPVRPCPRTTVGFSSEVLSW